MMSYSPLSSPEASAVRVAAMAQQQHVGVLLMKDAQVLGQVAVFIALRISKAQVALQPGGGLADARKRHNRYTYSSRASLRNTFPAGVSETGRLLRSNSLAPTVSSSARICWVMAVCEMY